MIRHCIVIVHPYISPSPAQCTRAHCTLHSAQCTLGLSAFCYCRLVAEFCWIFAARLLIRNAFHFEPSSIFLLRKHIHFLSKKWLEKPSIIGVRNLPNSATEQTQQKADRPSVQCARALNCAVEKTHVHTHLYLSCTIDYHIRYRYLVPGTRYLTLL